MYLLQIRILYDADTNGISLSSAILGDEDGVQIEYDLASVLREELESFLKRTLRAKEMEMEPAVERWASRSADANQDLSDMTWDEMLEELEGGNDDE